MVPDLEKPQITEIQVRMDCNGCVQKIKKALHGIYGIYDFHIDFRQQRLTIIGWADPERVIEAIKKTRKIATICSHTQAGDPKPQTTEPEAEPANSTEAANPPPSEAPPTEPPPPAVPTKESPPPEDPRPMVAPSTVINDANAAQPVGPSEPGNVKAIHIIHHWHESPHIVTHSYNYRPSPSVPSYMMDYPNQDHDHICSNSSGDPITSMFSDENPNACRIV